LIGFDKAGKRFGTLDAVKEFSMTIQDEEILGLLGPNGAGKTTLMLMMGTVYRPTSGKISVNGLDVVQHPNDVRKMIGIAFQDPRVDGILGAFDVLNWHLKMTTNLDKVEREDRVEKVLRAVDLWDARNKRTWLMSGGMRKKVEDCKVLAQRPKIAVFDEPTAFLDVPSRLLMWKMNQENNKVTVYLSGGRLLLPKIVETLTNRGVKIDSVHLKEVTLEDVFLNYTGHRLE